MSEQKTDTQRCDARDIHQCMSIHTHKTTDSCRDKDCIEDLRVYLTTNSQAILDAAETVIPAAKKAVGAYEAAAAAAAGEIAEAVAAAAGAVQYVSPIPPVPGPIIDPGPTTDPGTTTTPGTAAPPPANKVMTDQEKADAKALMDFHGHPEKMSFGQLTDIDDL